ncbi:hypothetical protein AOCH_005048 [Aspergillus ochraceoroseus]|uniref:Cation transporter n=1 Tax=Aspergillus ochraceoroseus TaxID=138278 RepID=A0A0F8UZ73_9EURO|nr:hypothetical protein AOCH_005048 [Aspergillus ochraceoroseus]
MPPAELHIDQSPLRLCHHYFYILFWVLVTAIILYVPGGLSLIDALLLASGAATQGGLNPVDLNKLHVVQQIALWVIPMVTNVIVLNTLIVLLRLYWFRNRFRHVLDQAKATSESEGIQESMEMNRSALSVAVSQGRTSQEQPLLVAASAAQEPDEGESGDLSGSSRTARSSVSSSTGLQVAFREPEIEDEPKHHHDRSYSEQQRGHHHHHHHHHDLSYLPAAVTRPHSLANYSDWNERQKEELGGIEYRALKTLLVILLCYFFLFHLLGLVVFVIWALSSAQYDHVFDSTEVNQTWWAIFTAGSAFNDLGYTLTPNSMESFRSAPFPLLLMTFLIIIGNTGFPCMLRFIIWLLSKVTSCGSALDEELQYLLDRPRRCFTLLFPSAETWRLGAVLLLLSVIDLAIFWALETTPYREEQISFGMEIVNGLFQIASTRTAGFSAMPLSQLYPGVQVSFIVMMYISAFPTAIAMRKTTVYEEQSLAIDEEPDAEHSQPGPAQGLVGHIQRQLGFDLWFMMLGFFTIAVVEGQRLRQSNNDDAAFALFPVLFEIVSAYGTVGLSLGYPGTDTSLCGEFTSVSKLVIVAMQVRGRHRGLPHAVDHAILLPREAGVSTQQEGREWWRWKRRFAFGRFFSRKQYQFR